MIKPFPDNAKCPICSKNLNKVALKELECLSCETAGERVVAQRTVLAHVWDAFVSLFNFEIFGVLASLKWAQEKLCKSGDYDRKTGKFYRKGYLKD